MHPFGEFLRKKGHDCRFLLDGWAREHAAQNLVSTEIVSRKAIEKFSGSALLVYGARQLFSKNYEMISHSRDAGIETLFVFDSWKNYLINFRDPSDGSMYLPSRIAVVDERMKEGVLKALSGYADEDLEKRVDILGHPAIDNSVAYIRQLTGERISTLKSRYNGEGSGILKLFVMEPIREDFSMVNGMDLGYDEQSILDYFLTRCCRGDEKILVKVHPRQSREEVQALLHDARRAEAGNAVQVVSEEKIENLIAIADEVYGMTSVALHVAIRCGKKVHSIQVGRNEQGKSISNPDLEACLIA